MRLSSGAAVTVSLIRKKKKHSDCNVWATARISPTRWRRSSLGLLRVALQRPFWRNASPTTEWCDTRTNCERLIRQKYGWWRPSSRSAWPGSPTLVRATLASCGRTLQWWQSRPLASSTTDDQTRKWPWCLVKGDKQSNLHKLRALKKDPEQLAFRVWALTRTGFPGPSPPKHCGYFVGTSSTRGEYSSKDACCAAICTE